MNYKIIFFVLFIVTIFACNKKVSDIVEEPAIIQVDPNEGKPKNIIFLIGDGMGLGQITAGMYANGNKTNLEKFPVIGLQKSHASNKLVTDSAAAATSFASGVKTYNGAIGVDSDTMPVPTILEIAEKRGYKSGLVASSTIVHATPACFYSHNKYRKNYEEIAMDLANAEVDFFVGGGNKFFERRTDEENLIRKLQDKGYDIPKYVDVDLQDVVLDYTQKFGYLTSDEDPLPQSLGRDYMITASSMAVDYLDKSSEDGNFFLMIEGSQIDWGGHSNDSKYIISEFIEFDKIIGNVLEFAKKDGETLVIVTADHETGGYAIQQESTMDSLVTAFTSNYHTAVMVPVFAYGPGSENFNGIYENTAIFDKMKKQLFVKNNRASN